MREVPRGLSIDTITELLDNGGRFHHVLCRAADGIVSTGELERASGFRGRHAGPFMFLELLIDHLSDDEQLEIIGRLTPRLQDAYRLIPRIGTYGSPELDPALLESLRGSAVLATGVLRSALPERFRDVVIVATAYHGGTASQGVPVRIETLHDAAVLETLDGELVIGLRRGLDAPFDQPVILGGGLYLSMAVAGGRRQPYMRPVLFQRLPRP